MNSVMLTFTDKKDLKLFTDLAKRLGISFKIFSDRELIDFGLIVEKKKRKKTEISTQKQKKIKTKKLKEVKTKKI